MEINFVGHLKEGSFSETHGAQRRELLQRLGFTALRTKFKLHRERKLITVE